MMSEGIHSCSGVNFSILHARNPNDVSVIVCHACDLAHRLDEIAPAARVRCVRCRAELYRTNAALGLYDQGYATLAVLVAITAMLVPLTQILAFLYVLVPVRVGLRAPGQ